MFVSSDGPLDQHCADAVAAIDALARHDPAMLDVAGQLVRLRTVSQLVDRLEAERVRLLGGVDQSGALDEHGAATWLQHNSSLSLSQAYARASFARRLPQLPVIAGAFARGDLGANHVSQILGLCRDVGTHNVAPKQDQIVQVATQLRTVEDLTQVCHQWRRELWSDAAEPAEAAEAAEAADDRAHDRRRSRITPAAELGPLRPRR
jgi:hypothetical protein